MEENYLFDMTGNDIMWSGDPNSLEKYTATYQTPGLPIIRVAKVYPDATLPTRKHSNDAGLDLYSNNIGFFVQPNGLEIANTGIAVEIPRGYVGQVWPKSRSNFLIGGGIIDAGYQGEILVKIFNPTDKPLLIHKGEAIAQLLILPVETPTMLEVSYAEFTGIKTERSTTGGITVQADPQKYRIEQFDGKIESIE